MRHRSLLWTRLDHAKSILRCSPTETIGHRWAQSRAVHRTANSSQRKTSSYLLLTVPTATFCLGCWQVYRRQWKLDLIDKLENTVRQPAIDFPEDLQELDQLEYRKIRLRGRFDHKQEMFISPRSLLKSDQNERSGGGVFSVKSNDSLGLWVITPFEVKDRNLRILVNRGWIPRHKLNQKTRLEGQTDEEIELVGVVRLAENRQPFGLDNPANSDVWHYRDIQGMAQRLNTAPIFIDADYKSTIAGGPIGGQTRVSLRNEHLSYIITWYGLTVIIAYMWYMKIYKRRPVF